MTLTLKAGMKLTSAVCNTQVMVLRAPKDALQVECGGTAMVTEEPSERGSINDDLAGGTLVGKRYVDEADRLEFLCTRAGDGQLVVNTEPLQIKQAKQLPSSD